MPLKKKIKEFKATLKKRKKMVSNVVSKNNRVDKEVLNKTVLRAKRMSGLSEKELAGKRIVFDDNNKGLKTNSRLNGKAVRKNGKITIFVRSDATDKVIAHELAHFTQKKVKINNKTSSKSQRLAEERRSKKVEKTFTKNNNVRLKKKKDLRKKKNAEMKKRVKADIRKKALSKPRKKIVRKKTTRKKK